MIQILCTVGTEFRDRAWYNYRLGKCFEMGEDNVLLATYQPES